ncbi:MAG: hypothetical protein MUF84_16290, partial [Anaerolineae bacterium]|nr:hypothetical protein [Anaerolineae bacterium]
MVRCQGSRRVLSFLGLVGVALAWALLLVAGVLAVSQPGRAEFDGARPQHGDASVGSDTCLAMTGGVTYTVLQEAIDHAGALGKVYVATGTCYEALSIAKSVTLTGGWSRAFPSLSQDPNSQSIVNALGAGRVISISKPFATLVTVVVEGMTLTGGDATGLGGGTGATDIGGGIFAEGVDLTVRNCVVHGNVASSSRSGRGGGIGTELCGDVILVGNVITGNTASLSGSGQGGGIADRNGKVVLTGNTIEDNTAAAGGGEGRGGGIWLDSISGDLSGNIVRANTASEMGSGSGGGLRAEIVQALSVSGGAFEGNTASATGTGNGGAMSLDRCDSSVSAVLVVGNRATTGGGVWATGG